MWRLLTGGVLMFFSHIAFLSWTNIANQGRPFVALMPAAVCVFFAVLALREVRRK